MYIGKFIIVTRIQTVFSYSLQILPSILLVILQSSLEQSVVQVWTVTFKIVQAKQNPEIQVLIMEENIVFHKIDQFNQNYALMCQEVGKTLPFLILLFNLSKYFKRTHEVQYRYSGKRKYILLLFC